MIPSGPAAFCVRFRPVMPGVHRLRLVARWAGGATAACDLPDLVATGGAWDGYVRIDRDDPRFFSVAGRFWWPVGLNLHNPFDVRSQEVLGTRLTPPRGTLAYGAILDRLSAAGGDATEIWLSSWNLALSWRADWSGFSGPSGINLANAERLDRILDHAWSRGIRVNLVLNNHGQASPKTDREWKDNPLNTANGGPLTEPAQVFEHPAALAHQERVRRYLAARYADHPAILGWKLWSEIDLTAGRGEALRGWHEQAAERWKVLDAYRHPVATHWSGDYRRVDGAIAALPQLDYLCLDAYRHAREDDDPTPLADILAGSLWDPKRGLARLRKPVLVTEYGGGAGPTPLEFRTVDHAIGGWIGLVCGHAGAPMLWWWEWVDQDGRWAPYRALRRFIAGEDLRGAGGRSYVLDAGPLWSRGWVRPGVVLGYLLDRRWGVRGGEAPRIGPARVRIADAVEAGRLEAGWWDADTGEQVGGRTISHPGGALDLESPAFAGHIAFKLRRIAP